MISQKVRNNASISYFFLGWLFLLAKNNPNFADSFIRQHAKAATKGHVFFFVAYFFYSHFLSSFFSYSIPVVGITVDHCIDIAFFATLTLFIVRGVYKGQKDESEEDVKNDRFFSREGRNFQFSGASEIQRIILLLSHIPLLGMIVSKRYPNVVTITGARISSIFGLAYIASIVHGWFDSLSMILLFVGIFLFVLLAARFFIHDSHIVPSFLERIPGAESLYAGARAIPPYIGDIIGVVFGKKDSLSFRTHLENIREKDQSFRASLQGYFTDETLPFKPFWIFIPFVNIVFLPKLFMARTTRYVLAIGQWLVITLLAGIIAITPLLDTSVGLFLLFPLSYGIASLESDVFIRIPVIYEIYAILNTLTFGLLKNTKRIQAVQKQETTVSYKVD